MQKLHRKMIPVLAPALLLGLASAAHAMVPESIQVPAGHQVAWETVGVGEIAYECRDKPDYIFWKAG
ncbi:hypothetical protein [Zobellella denitrificans]